MWSAIDIIKDERDRYKEALEKISEYYTATFPNMPGHWLGAGAKDIAKEALHPTETASLR